MEMVIIDVGDDVICDVCGEDKTNSEISGGMLFQSKAICPDCAPGFELSARKYSELHFIKARCPDELSFPNWVRTLR